MILLIGSFTASKSQYIELTDTLDQFPMQVDSMLKQWGPKGDSVAGNFSFLWGSLSESEQETLMEISLEFRKRKYRVNPYFYKLYNACYNAYNGDASDRVDPGQFLEVAKKVVDDNQNPRQILRFFATADKLFEQYALYHSGYNILSVPEGSGFEIEYVAPTIVDEIGIPDEVLNQQGSMDEFGDEGDDFGSEEEDPFGTNDWGSEDDWGDDDSWDDDSWDDDSWGDDDWGDDSDDSYADFDDDENLDNYGGGFDEDFDPFADAAPVVELPTIEGATIKIENADFEFYTPYDTFLITNVSGTYIFGSRSFIADTGIMLITIPLDGYDTEAEIRFGQFAFNTINPFIEVENAVVTYDELFSEDIKGSFVFKSFQPKPSGPKYPIFRSYKSNFEYKELSEGVKLTGGFTLIGDKISTQGQDLGIGKLELSHDNQVFLKGESERFYLRDSLLKSHRMNLIAYTDNDSLYHPSMGMSFNMPSEKLTLYWEKGPFKDRPMIDSYHQVEIRADKMTWDFNDREIDFGVIEGRSEVPAVITSMNNFDSQEYLRLKGINKFHPVQAAAYFYKKNRMEEFSPFELAESYNVNPNNMKKAIINAAGKGYLDYDMRSGLISLNYKTKHAYNANFKKSDFDNMQWYSISPTGYNATKFLDSGYMVIRGVDREIVSKELGVYYEPDSGIVILKENRDFEFDGEIFAGNYAINGVDFDFEYDAFKMNLLQIDSIEFNLTNDSTGEESKRQIMGGSIEETSGTFYLNEPDNKSGKKSLPQYPILDVTEPSYVYFDDPDILDGAYDREVYFEIPQFKIDTLESDNPSVINVKGIFHSGGILPDFETVLGVNPDLSLGFKHEIPDSGYSVFGNDETKFYNSIEMNRDGLTGIGQFDYLTSTTDAQNVTFYQDSMVIHDGVIDVKAADTKHGNYPDAKCANAKGVLMAGNERYIINSKYEEPVELYNGEARLEGAAMISKKGMYGIGDVYTKGSDSKSKNFKFEQDGFTGRNAEFLIEAVDQDTFALYAEDVRLSFDMIANTAKLEPEKRGNASISLPLMSYKTSIPIGTWDLEQQTFSMEKPDYVDLDHSYFYSTLEDQDSLAFSGTSAVYDAVAYSLTVKGVPGIHVGDSYITPGDSTVIIDETALIQPLYGAKIKMTATEGYHYLDSAEVDIYDRHKFDAVASYIYVTGETDTASIFFDGLYQVPDELSKKREDSITYGEAYIEEEARFFISPKILFQGDVAVYSNREFLEFDGEIRLDLRHTDEFNDWLPFKYSGDPDEIIIELEEESPDPEAAEPMLTTGIHVDGGESQMYYTFLSGKRMDDDPDIFKASGVLSINSESGEFEVGSEERLSGETKKGNYFQYNDSTGKIKLEGEIEYYGYMPPEVNAKSYGFGHVDVEKERYEYHTLTYLNFPVPGNALSAFAEEMSLQAEYTDNLKDAGRSRDIQNKLSLMMGVKAAENFIDQSYVDYTPLYYANSKFGKNILFADLQMKWHAEEGALFSGDTIGLASIGRNDINGKVKGYYEIKKIYEDEIINLYLELKPNCWIYFNYDGGRMSTFSSNHLYNEIVESRSKSPESGAAPPGELYLASSDLYEVTDFIKYYNETYLGIILKDEDVKLTVSKPDLDEEPSASRRQKPDDDYDQGGWGADEGYDDYEDDDDVGGGWGSDDEDEDDGWGAGNDDEDGWGSDEEEEDDDINSGFGSFDDEEEDDGDGWGAGLDTEEEEEEDPIETNRFNDYDDEEEEDDEWGWDEEEEEDPYYGAPPKLSKKEEKRRKKDRERIRKGIEKRKEDLKEEGVQEVQSFGSSDDDEEEDSDWGWGGDDEEEDDDGGWGSSDDDDDVVIKNEKEVEKKEVKEEEEEDSGWGWGSDDEEEEDEWGSFDDEEEDDVEIKNDKAEEEAKRKAEEEAKRKAQEEADRLRKEAEEKARRKEEERKKREEEEEDSGWGWGSDEEEEEEDGWGSFDDEQDDDVEIQNDRAEEEAKQKAEEEAKRKAEEERLRKEAEDKAKKEAEEKARKEEEERKKREEEEERKRLEEEERKKREDEEKKIVVEDEEEDSGWGWGGDEEEEDDDGGWGSSDDDEDVEINNKKEEEEAKRKAEEEAEKKRKEEEEKKKKEEEEKKKKEEEEKRKKEEEEAKKKAEEEAAEELEDEEEEDDWDGF